MSAELPKEAEEVQSVQTHSLKVKNKLDLINPSCISQQHHLEKQYILNIIPLHF